MRASHLLVAASVTALLVSNAAWAGVPLKGVDVKLGKNPGGSCAARTTCAATTNAEGVADFGVPPAGAYTLALQAPKPMAMHISITGGSGGPIEREAPAEASAGRQAPIAVSLDGRAPLRVVVTAP